MEVDYSSLNLIFRAGGLEIKTAMPMDLWVTSQNKPSQKN